MGGSCKQGERAGQRGAGHPTLRPPVPASTPHHQCFHPSCPPLTAEPADLPHLPCTAQWPRPKRPRDIPALPGRLPAGCAPCCNSSPPHSSTPLPPLTPQPALHPSLMKPPLPSVASTLSPAPHPGNHHNYQRRDWLTDLAGRLVVAVWAVDAPHVVRGDQPPHRVGGSYLLLLSQDGLARHQRVQHLRGRRGGAPTIRLETTTVTVAQWWWWRWWWAGRPAVNQPTAWEGCIGA